MKDSRSSSRTPFKIAARYDYTDADGQFLFQVVRLDPKDFRQRRRPRPDDTVETIRRGWVWKVEPSLLVLYRLPRVVEAIRRGQEIWVPEGEKDVHALEDAGVTATTNPGGAGNWRKEYSEWLAQAGLAAGCDGFLRQIRLMIVRDKDKPDLPKSGQAHAQDLAWSFTEHNLSWRAVEAAEGKDAHDHLAAGLGLDEFVPIEVPAERPNRSAFNGYRRRRTHGVNWSEGPERISREFEGWS